MPLEQIVCYIRTDMGINHVDEVPVTSRPSGTPRPCRANLAYLICFRQEQLHAEIA